MTATFVDKVMLVLGLGSLLHAAFSAAQRKFAFLLCVQDEFRMVGNGITNSDQATFVLFYVLS